MELTHETWALFEDEPEASGKADDRPMYVTLTLGAVVGLVLLPVLFVAYETAPLVKVAVVASLLGNLIACSGALLVTLARHGKRLWDRTRRDGRCAN